MAKSIPEVACGSHHNSRKKSDTAAEALSESEINAVMQLIQISRADSYSDHTDHHQEDDDNSSNINNSFSFSFSKVEEGGKSSVHAAASSSYSSSPPPPPPPVAAVLSMEAEKGELAEEDNDGDDIDRNNLGERRNKRYRSIVELYRVTDETALMSVVKSNKRKKKKKEMQQRAN